jgi:hypothetical protein
MVRFFYVYILQSELDPERFYTGLTDDSTQTAEGITIRAVCFIQLSGGRGG